MRSARDVRASVNNPGQAWPCHLPAGPAVDRSSASTPQSAPAPRACPLDTTPTGSGRGRPKAGRDPLGCLFLNAVLPLLLRLTCSSCPRSGSPPGLVLRHSPWLPPAGQPSPGRAVLSPSALPSLPSAQTPPTLPLPPLSLALLSPLIHLGVPVPQNSPAHTQTSCLPASHLQWPQSWLSE